MRISDWSSDVCSSDLLLISTLVEVLGAGLQVVDDDVVVVGLVVGAGAAAGGGGQAVGRESVPHHGAGGVPLRLPRHGHARGVSLAAPAREREVDLLRHVTAQSQARAGAQSDPCT